MKTSLGVVVREQDGICILENGMRVRFGESGHVTCVGWEAPEGRAPSISRNAEPKEPVMTYNEAIKRACDCATSGNYAGSTAWLDIARELRLREGRELDTKKPAKPKANSSSRHRSNAGGLNFD